MRNEPPEYRKEWAQAFSEGLGYFTRFGASVLIALLGLLLILIADEGQEGRFLQAFGALLLVAGLGFGGFALRLMYSALTDAVDLVQGRAPGLGRRVLRLAAMTLVIAVGLGSLAALIEAGPVLEALLPKAGG